MCSVLSVFSDMLTEKVMTLTRFFLIKKTNYEVFSHISIIILTFEIYGLNYEFSTFVLPCILTTSLIYTLLFSFLNCPSLKKPTNSNTLLSLLLVIGQPPPFWPAPCCPQLLPTSDSRLATVAASNLVHIKVGASSPMAIMMKEERGRGNLCV